MSPPALTGAARAARRAPGGNRGQRPAPAVRYLVARTSRPGGQSGLSPGPVPRVVPMSCADPVTLWITQAKEGHPAAVRLLPGRSFGRRVQSAPPRPDVRAQAAAPPPTWEDRPA